MSKDEENLNSLFMKHLRKMKLANNINECYFIDEKCLHIKVFPHINTYHLSVLIVKDIKKALPPYPDCSSPLALCNKCHLHSFLLPSHLSYFTQRSILHACDLHWDSAGALQSLRKTPLDLFPGYGSNTGTQQLLTPYSIACVMPDAIHFWWSPVPLVLTLTSNQRFL